MKTIIFFGLFNSIGSLAFWTLLGPKVVQQFGTATILGTIAMTRQISFLVGTLCGGLWADSGRPYQKYIILQCVELALGLSMLTYLISQQSLPSPTELIVWCLVRFFFGGFAFVVSYKVFSELTSSLGVGSILHLLITQGANVFGPLISFALASDSVQSMIYASLIDTFTSLVFVFLLILLRNSSLNKKQLSTQTREVFRKKILKVITAYWGRKLFPWNMAQILLLIGTGGTLVFLQQTAEAVDPNYSQKIYSLSLSAYGVSLWLTGWLVSKVTKPRAPLVCGAILLLSSGILGAFDTLPYLEISFLLIAFWLVLHSTNKLLLDLCIPEEAALIRSSMLFYLSIIFGMMEFVVSWIYEFDYGQSFVTWQHILSGLLILAVVHIKRFV